MAVGVLPTVDLHAAYAKETNTRVTDITTGKPLTNRFGVNLHWTVPRHYRVSAASGRSDAEEERSRSPQHNQYVHGRRAVLDRSES